ncbi:hypothetical protein DFH06DRAFT_1347907 [Mycena polygramma]|nr:hypothetical protein DFH06DRAFT_1347907 [Mycena polygramma]
MTHHSRSQPAQPELSSTAFGQPLMVMLMPLVFVAGFPALSAGAVMPAPAPPARAPAAVPAAAPRPDATATVPDAAPPAPAVRAPVPAGAGLPAPLVAMLRDGEGPFVANEVFRVTPSEPLGPIDETVPAPEWYAITRGRFVGVVDHALSAVAISGVAHAARKAYTTQALALDAFNKALTWGGVTVA